jgi:hypothetical protein
MLLVSRDIEMALNEFTPGAVIATKGSKVHWRGFPARDGHEKLPLCYLCSCVAQYDTRLGGQRWLSQ